MDPIESAACVILGVFAVLFSWTGFSRRKPTASTTASATVTASTTVTRVAHKPTGTPDLSEEAVGYIHEACGVHARWSGATGNHVACFDLFDILQTDMVSFSGDADAFAAVIGPAIDGNTSGRDDEEVQVLLLSYQYLCDDGRRAVYVSQLMPLIAEQRKASKLDCSSNVPFPAHLYRPPYTSGPGVMDRACGW